MKIAARSRIRSVPCIHAGAGSMEGEEPPDSGFFLLTIPVSKMLKTEGRQVSEPGQLPDRLRGASQNKMSCPGPLFAVVSFTTSGVEDEGRAGPRPAHLLRECKINVKKTLDRGIYRC
jgi:hypothetical protein